MTHRSHKSYWQKGFGLVEIAITLVVIGILIGAALQGKRFIDQARLNSTLAEVQKLRLSIQQFKEKYGFLPGDFPFASRDIHSELPNGEGTGILNGNPFSIASNAGRFWAHLYGDDGIFYFNQTMLNYGNGIPESSLGGGYTLVYSPTEAMDGNWIVLGTKLNDQSGEGGLLTPEQASFINKKLDNGSPVTGQVRSLDANRQLSGKCIKDGRYNLKVKDNVCVMYFKVDE